MNEMKVGGVTCNVRRFTMTEVEDVYTEEYERRFHLLHCGFRSGVPMAVGRCTTGERVYAQPTARGASIGAVKMGMNRIVGSHGIVRVVGA